MIGKVFTVAVREIVETVKTKAFLISALVMPLLIGGAVYGYSSIAEAIQREDQPTRRIAVLDHNGAVFAELEARCAEYNEKYPRRQLVVVEVADPDADKLRNMVRDGNWNAYVIVPENIAVGETTCELGRKDLQLETGLRLQDMIDDAVFAARCHQADPPIDPEVVRRLQERVALRTIDVQSGDEVTGDEFARMATPFAFMFLLMMATLGISQGLLTTVIEEKSSRVVEVLLSAISPTQLMAGKILGMAAVGLMMLGIWCTVGYVSAQARGMGYLVSGYNVAIALLYFVPGFLLLSSLLASIGSACNTLKDAQGMAFPLSIITVVPMFLWMYISQSPSSPVSVALSFVPPMTPFVMILRVCSDVHTPVWQILATLALLWVSVIAAMWATGKIFRIGVLMYGKPPSPRELVRWLRYA